MSYNRKRLDIIAKALTPKQAILAWLALEPQFDSVRDEAKLLATHTISDNPLTRLSDQIEGGLRASLKGKLELSINNAVFKGVREVAFLFFLRESLQTNVGQSIMATRLAGAGLIDLIRMMHQNDSMRDQHQQVIGYFSEVAYPLHVADAAAVSAALRHRVITFSELQTQRIGEFGTAAESSRRKGRVACPDSVVTWARAHFSRQGCPMIPQEAYLGRKRGEPNQDRPETRVGLRPRQEEPLELFGSTYTYNAFASSRDFSFGLADLPDRDFLQLLEAVLKALRELVSSGAVEKARAVVLPSVPLAFLRQAPLIEGVWIDRYIVELAEFGAVLADHGFDTVKDGDRHPLACLSISSLDTSGSNVSAIREQVGTRVSNFGGRSRLIDGRPYLNLSDYREWSERKLRGELRLEEGFLIESFNRWVEQSEPGAAELAGITVEPIYPPFSESDFVAYPEVEDAADAQERRREIIDRLAARDADEDPTARWRELFRAFATKILTAQALVEYVQKHYFDGREILGKILVTQVEEAVRRVDELANGFDNLIAVRGVPRFSGFSASSTLEAIKKSIEPEASAKSLVSEAKIRALHFVGRKQEGLNLLRAEMLEIAE